MKKLFTTLLFALAGSAVSALPVGNPSDASLLRDGLFLEGTCSDPCDPCASWCDAFSIRFGFYGDYVFNRHLETNSSDFESVVEHTQLNTNAGLIVLNLWDRLDIFSTLGATDLSITTNENTFSTIAGQNLGRFELETDTHFSWSIGARATLFEVGCTNLGIEGQYFSMKPHISRITVDATDSLYPMDGIDFRYREWQFALGLSHRINVFVPYIALNWSRVLCSADHALVGVPVSGTYEIRTLTNSKDVGYAVGVSLVDCEKMSLTVEGRFASEKALHVNGQIRF